MAPGRHSSDERATHDAPGVDPEGGLADAAAPAAGHRAKVVPLRGARLQPPGREMLSVTELTIDLHAAIDCLRSVRTDLEIQYWTRRGQGESDDSARYQISLWVRQV